MIIHTLFETREQKDSSCRAPFWHRHPVIVLVLVNVILRGLWLTIMHPPQLYDFLWYYNHAVQILHGQGYQMFGHPTAYWPIGYPIFLSLVFRVTGPSVVIGLMVNALLSTCIVVLIYFMCMRTFASRKIGFVAGVGYTLLPSAVEWNAVLGSEELFTMFLCLSLLIYVWVGKTNKLSLIFLSGIILGFACDVRPIPLLFPFVVFIYERWGARRPWKTSVLFTLVYSAGLVLAVLPVTIRNFVVLHHFILVSTNGGVNLWQGTMSDGAYFWSWNPKVNPLLAAGTNQILENQIGTHAALNYIFAHPFSTVVHGFAKWFFLYWVDWNVVSVTFALAHWSGGWTTFAMWGNTVWYWIWMAVVGAGLTHVLSRKIRRYIPKGSWLILGYIVYNTAIFFFFPAWDRFRFPLMPLFAIWFGIGLLHFTTKLRKKRTGTE